MRSFLLILMGIALIFFRSCRLGQNLCSIYTPFTLYISSNYIKLDLVLQNETSLIILLKLAFPDFFFLLSLPISTSIRLFDSTSHPEQKLPHGTEFLFSPVQRLLLVSHNNYNLQENYAHLGSQLPRPIKGTGLAKGPIPLYLSVVCSSCIWS